MGLFSGLEGMGLEGFKDTSIIEKKDAVDSAGDGSASSEKKESDYLIDRRYTCPVCETVFTTRSVKAGKVRIESKDTDLKPIYDFVDVGKYDAITCDSCGYSSLTKYFGKITSKQVKLVKEKVSACFNRDSIDNKKEIYDYDDAIKRYKLALVCTVVKNAKNGERAYTSLRLAWILRSKRLSLPENDPMVKSLYEDELEGLKAAFEGFQLAMSDEDFPIAGMDEMTLKFVLADIARKFKNYNAAARFVADIMISKKASSRLKDEAYNLRERIKEDMKSDVASIKPS